MEPRAATIKIRLANAEDAAAIATTYSVAKRQSLPELFTDRDGDLDFQTARWHQYLTKGSTAQFSKGDGFVTVAELEGEMVGFVAWHSSARYGAEAELQSLYVLREYQNQGIGQALLIEAASQARSQGIESMCVGYDPVNPYRRFYAKNGAEVLNDHWSIWRDLALLVRSSR